MRIWNADNYTRIIIELGGQAKYQAARIADPDRIYFDIENARLSTELVHQPIEVPAGVTVAMEESAMCQRIFAFATGRRRASTSRAETAIFSPRLVRR